MHERRSHGICGGVALGSDYTPEEVDFLRAIDRYKREQHRPHPTWREVLQVLRQLGWTPPPRPVAGEAAQDSPAA